MVKVTWKIRTFLLMQKCHYLWMAISGHFHTTSYGSDHPKKWVDQTTTLFSMLVNIEVSDGHRLPERSIHAFSGNVCRTLSRWARRLILCTFVKITLQYPPMPYALLYTSMNIVRNTNRAEQLRVRFGPVNSQSAQALYNRDCIQFRPNGMLS